MLSSMSQLDPGLDLHTMKEAYRLLLGPYQEGRKKAVNDDDFRIAYLEKTHIFFY